MTLKSLKHPVGSLFVEEAEHDYTGLNWSYSRRESLEQCTRRYFFQYYTAELQNTEMRNRAQFLKNVKNRFLRSGELVHLVISTYFKNLKKGKTLSADWAAKWAKELFAKDRNYSAHVRGGGLLWQQQYPPTILDEIMNSSENGAALLIQTEEQMVSSIRNFFGASAFSDFRRLGASAQSRIEAKLSLTGFPVPVSGKVDLAVPMETSVTIVDWKTGAVSDGGAESLQLATYGLWGSAEFGVKEDSVEIAKAYLLTGEVVEFKAGAEAFANARVRIHQDLERMLILHEYGRTGVIDAFTPNPQLGVCRLCPFREICPEGKALIHA
jgi:hypothetical protein